MINRFSPCYKCEGNCDECGVIRKAEGSTKFKVAKFGVFVFHAVAIIMCLLLRQWITAIWVLNSAIWAAAYFNAKEG